MSKLKILSTLLYENHSDFVKAQYDRKLTVALKRNSKLYALEIMDEYPFAAEIEEFHGFDAVVAEEIFVAVKEACTERRNNEILRKEDKFAKEVYNEIETHKDYAEAIIYQALDRARNGHYTLKD